MDKGGMMMISMVFAPASGITKRWSGGSGVRKVSAVYAGPFPPLDTFGDIGDTVTDSLSCVMFEKTSVYGVGRWRNVSASPLLSIGSLPVLSYMGDSIGTGQFTGQGPLEYLCAMSMGYLVCGKNASIGGQTSTQMLARYNADIMAFAHDITIISCMTNDLIYSIDDTTSYNNVLAMVDIEIAAGKRPVLAYIPPHASYVAGVAAKNAIMDSIATLRNLGPVLNYWAPFAYADYSGWLPGMTIGDGVHPTDECRWDAMRVAIWQLGTASTPPQFAVTNTQVGSLLANNLFQTDTNSDGIPDLWTSVSGASAMSLIDSPWGVGKAILSDNPTPTTGTGIIRSNSIAAEGRIVRVTARIKGEELSADAFVRLGMQYTSGSNTYSDSLRLNIANTGDVACNFQQPIPSGATGIRLIAGLATRSTGVAVSGKVTIAQLAVYDVGAS